MAMLWQNIMEEATSCIVPMVQTGIGSALVNEQHVLSLEASVEMIPIDILKPMEMDALLDRGQCESEYSGFYRAA